MKNITDFKTLMEFTDYFRDEQTCVEHFTAARFRNGEYCPHYRHDKIYKCAGGKRYHCAGCQQDFTIRTKTVFGESKLPLRKWYMAVYLLSTTSKGISSIQLAKHVGVTQKTAWFMDHRLRSAMQQNGGKLFGTIEVDETFVGGVAKNMHEKVKKARGIGTGGKGKAILLGMRQRDGDVKAQVVDGTGAETLRPVIKANVESGAKLYTDEHPAYNGVADYVRFNVNHSKKQFVMGIVHTNGIESFWALFKRGFHGVYHQMSKKHLQKYVDECAYRLNRRGQDVDEVFAGVVERTVDGQPLPYKQLTA